MRMIARRIAFYVVTAIVAITVNFFIPRLMPGNPALAVLGRAQARETPQAIAALELQYGVQTKTGLWGQYVQYWVHLLHGNLGTSLNSYPASVGSLIRAALPWTIGLVGIATVISFVLGTLLGVAVAWRRGSWLALLDPSYANDISPTSNATKVAQLLTGDGYAKTGGKWMKNGQPIKFSIEDPSSYTDYATDAQLIATQLNAEGFVVSFDGVQATQWYNDYPVGNFDAIIHWSNQGPTPYDYFDYWMDNSLSAPIGKPAGSDYGRFNNPQVQAALAQYAGTDDTATQQQALNTLETIVSTQAPVIPLLYGAAWYEYSTKDYTGWPTQANQYIDPVPNAPYMEYTLLHLTPAS